MGFSLLNSEKNADFFVPHIYLGMGLSFCGDGFECPL